MEQEAKKVYLGNLEYSLTENEIRQAIEEKGIKVKDVKVITDKFSGRPKGFGFAEFETEEEADKAIQALDGQQLKGRTLKVNKARKRERRDFGNYSSQR